jgi:DNA-binding PadR family transcriptional regulator
VPRGQEPAAFPAWLRRIAITVALNARRSRRATFLRLDDIPASREALTNYIRIRYICARYMPALTTAVVHVLLALGAGDRHGYGILKDVLSQSHGKVRLGPGTIYGTLQRLMELGWVEETDAPPRAKDADPRRRYYRLTRDGREALRGEIERLDGIVRVARSHHVLPSKSHS